jgi:Ca2+:H+ antiporter
MKKRLTSLPFQVRSIPVHSLLLLAHLVPIVLLAKQIATFVDTGIYSTGLPPALGGVVIALIVLSPEAMVAIRAARLNLMQQSVNICLGSGLATIGLTVPAVLTVSFLTGVRVELGLKPQDIALLLMTILLSMQTFGSDRTNYLQGVLHLVLFGAYFVLIFE